MNNTEKLKESLENCGTTVPSAMHGSRDIGIRPRSSYRRSSTRYLDRKDKRWRDI